MTLDPLSGKVYWKARPEGNLKDRQWNGRFAGKEVGGKTKEGYLRTTISWDGKMVALLVHRIVWALGCGRWPEGDLDHKDQVKSNNAPGNLRPCTRSRNIANRTQVNSHGYKGVGYDRRVGNYFARITSEGSTIYLGSAESAIVAARLYDAAAVRYFGEFADLNFKQEVCHD
tara:strand:- start:115 stop:630 length:516 start_codon:yes stop_codon:yes gene_type:complete